MAPQPSLGWPDDSGGRQMSLDEALAKRAKDLHCGGAVAHLPVRRPTFKPDRTGGCRGRDCGDTGDIA